jgi:hypothetical protein
MSESSLKSRSGSFCAANNFKAIVLAENAIAAYRGIFHDMTKMPDFGAIPD